MTFSIDYLFFFEKEILPPRGGRTAKIDGIVLLRGEENDYQRIKEK
jgi:hypothetical protein